MNLHERPQDAFRRILAGRPRFPHGGGKRYICTSSDCRSEYDLHEALAGNEGLCERCGAPLVRKGS